jgi:hypothetical protein
LASGGKWMLERRIKPRWQIDQDAELMVENGVKPIPCVVEDLSFGGLRICLRRKLFDDVFSNFKLSLAGDLELNLNAQVVWREDEEGRNTYGLAFELAGEAVKTRIDQYLKKNFPDLLIKHLWKGSNGGTQEVN